MTVDLAHEVLADLWGDEKTIIPIELIQRKVSEFFGSALRAAGQDRTKAVASSSDRHVSCAQLTHASLAEVGRAFGGKDHTTVLHASARSRPCFAKIPRCGRPSTGHPKAHPPLMQIV